MKTIFRFGLNIFRVVDFIDGHEDTRVQSLDDCFAPPSRSKTYFTLSAIVLGQ